MGKPQLLAIDDEPDVADFIAEVAKLVGYQAEVATKAVQLLDVAALSHYRVIVLDLFMPDIDGLEMIDALAEAGCKAALILVSGHDQTFLQVAGKVAKVKGLNTLGTLTKPFQIDELEAMLKGPLTGC